MVCEPFDDKKILISCIKNLNLGLLFPQKTVLYAPRLGR